MQTMKRPTGMSCIASVDSDILPTGAVILQTTSEGKIQAYRSQQEKDKYPDRINLDRRGLTKLPQLVGESRLRLLSLQHNLINKLDGFMTQGLSKLVFLDLYDNQLERIQGLECLENLRVLLIGKNRLRRIEGLDAQTKLEVLDLHGNQITQVGNLSTQSELKVLNLAGNQIRIIGINDLQGLRSLQELNLRRNRLKRLSGFGDTPMLQKLFLSNNEIQLVEHMHSIIKAAQLKEITIDSNPVALAGDYASYLVSYLPLLKLLNNMEVNDSVRKAALSWRQNRELQSNITENKTSDMSNNVKRKEVISNARTNWELLRSQTKYLATGTLSNSMKDLRFDNDYEGGSEKCVQSDSGISVASFSTNFQDSVDGNEPCNFHSFNDSSKRKLTYSRLSQDSEYSQGSSITSNLNVIDICKLPPLSRDLNVNIDLRSGEITANASSPDVKCDSIKRCDSLSSVEPNIDSSFSSLPSYSSSDEELDSSEELFSPQASIQFPDEAPRIVKSASQCRKIATRKVQTRATTSKPKSKPVTPAPKVREQGGDFLVEICGRSLNVFGQGALRFIDRPWNASKAADVTTVKFNYVNFNSIVSILGRIKQRFPNAENYTFKETNMYCLGQLNALADIQGLTCILIEPEGNPIVQKDWEKYAVYRLAHWGLRTINGKEVTDELIASAAIEFSGLTDIVLWSLPEAVFQPLLCRLRLEGTRANPQQTAKQWLWNADPALRSVVAKEALQWRRACLTQEDIVWRHKGRMHLTYLVELMLTAIEKLNILKIEWPSILTELVRDTLVDYSHIDSYMKKCMQELRL